MKFYKFLISLISLIIILTLSIHPVLADDEEHELSHDFSSITVSSNNTSVPPINSKSAIIYDRSSGSILYGKYEKGAEALFRSAQEPNGQSRHAICFPSFPCGRTDAG